MAKFELNPNERLIGQEQASYIKKWLVILNNVNEGRLYVTDQRVTFETAGFHEKIMDYPINEVKSFSLGKLIALNIETTDGKVHKITGMFNKKLRDYMLHVGITEAKK